MASSSSLHDIILQQVFPAAGALTGLFMSFAPYRAVLKASRDGSLGDLNATPWVFMLGNCAGWVAYSFLVQNVYIFLPNAPGVILAIWLNIQAIKLQYENYRSKEMQDAIIAALEEHSVMGNSKKKVFQKSEVTELVETIITEEALPPPDIIHLKTTAPILEEEAGAESNHSTGTGTGTTTAADPSTTSPAVVAGNHEEGDLSLEDSKEKHDNDNNEGVATVLEDAAEMIVDYASFIWDITAQKAPAPASHELMVVGISTFWLLLFTVAALGRPFLDESTRILVIGLAVNCNLIFFYGAPLSHIATVLDTKCSKSIHVPTMIMSMANGCLWFFYGVEVRDAFVAVPNGFGAILGVVQLVLCLLYPRHVSYNNANGGHGIFKRDSSQSLSLPEESTPLI